MWRQTTIAQYDLSLIYSDKRLDVRKKTANIIELRNSVNKELAPFVVAASVYYVSLEKVRNCVEKVVATKHLVSKHNI